MLFKLKGKVDSLSGSSDINNCESHSNKCYLIKFCGPKIPKGHMYTVKTKGPTTEPFGKPDNNNLMVEMGVSLHDRLHQMTETYMVCNLLLHYEDCF